MRKNPHDLIEGVYRRRFESGARAQRVKILLSEEQAGRMRSQRVGHGQGILPQCGTGIGSQTESEAKGNCEASIGTPRCELIDREQLCWRQIDIEGLIGAEQPARAVWE